MLKKHYEQLHRNNNISIGRSYLEHYVENELTNVEKNGVIVSVNKPTVKCPEKFLLQYKMEDFKIENIIANGNFDMLKYQQLVVSNKDADEEGLKMLELKFDEIIKKGE